MKKISLLLCLLTFAICADAQSKREERDAKKEARREKVNELIRQSEDGVLVFQKQNVFGIQLRTNGYGAFYEKAIMKSNSKANLFRLDIAEIKHEKEEKVSGSDQIFGNPFIYGKKNYFYSTTLGLGQQRMLGQKGNKNGVAVSAVYYGGLSLGLLRPYYVTVENSAGEAETIKFDDDSTTFLQGPFFGGGGFGKGWSEIKIKPGAFVKGGLRFDYGRFNESVTALEIGMSLEAYASKIPLMYNQKDQQIFFQGYIAILFGRRK